ncbi:MAG: hypothetical protein ACYDCK_09270 [Thermoplasmatota archaeon]
MTPKRRVLLAFAALLGALLTFTVWNPNGMIREGLRDNFIAEFAGGLITVLFVDRTLDAMDDRTERRTRAELDRAVLASLDASLYGLWSLLVPALPREDAMRHDTHTRRLARMLHELAEPATWTNAPDAHAGAVRARVRDIEASADRLLALAEGATALGLRERLEELAEAARALDESWAATPRSQLAATFEAGVGRAARQTLAAIASRSG